MKVKEEKVEKKEKAGINPGDYPDYGDFIKAKREAEAKK